MKGAEKFGKKFVPQMRGIHPGTLLSSGSALKEPFIQVATNSTHVTHEVLVGAVSK